MTFQRVCKVALVLCSSSVVALGLAAADDSAVVTDSQTVSEKSLPSTSEARVRAELLHYAFHTTLQEIHHAYFREDEKIAC